MSEDKIFIDIPVEILNVGFKIEKYDPIRPILENLKSIEELNSNSETINRLMAISRSSKFSNDSIYFPGRLIRDLWKGKYWSLKESNLSLEMNKPGSSHKLDNIPLLDVKASAGEVKNLAKPFRGWLSKKSGINKTKVLAHTRLDNLESENEIMYLRALISRKKDSAGRRYWIHEDGPFKQLINDNIHTVTGFEVDEQQVKTEQYDWPYAPEVNDLQILRNKFFKGQKFSKENNSLGASTKIGNKRNTEQIIKESTIILDKIRDNLRYDKRPRLNKIETVIEFSKTCGMPIKVINSANSQVFILSSFTNEKYLDDIANMLSEVSRKKEKDLILAFGEPDRGQSLGYVEQTTNYISTICKKTKVQIAGGISESSNHSKVIVSDTGMVLIGSCNLFSGSLNSGVLESALLIDDTKCAAEILEIVIQEKWCASNQQSRLKQILTKINNKKYVSFIPNLNKKISDIKRLLNRGNLWYALSMLERVLCEISERPVWSLIKNLQHRPFMEDCIEKFETRLVMASDGLRSNGLDKASIMKIGQRAAQSHADVHIWWGRHAPNSKPFDEVDKRGRKEAKTRLEELRKLIVDSEDRILWKLLPKKSNQPMETHAKMFIVDDVRLMITSDNTLSFGDTEAERGDAGELGIVIDHPRLALQARGSMEAWLPNEAIIPNDAARWWALLAEEISVLSDGIYHQIPLEHALDALVERIEGNDWLRTRWENEIESKLTHAEILEKLTLGVKYGVFAVNEKINSQGVKSRISLDKLSEAVVSLVKKNRWSAIFRDMIDEILISALNQYNSKSGKRPHFILQGGRDYKFSFKDRLLEMEFDESFVLPYLEKHESEIIELVSSYYGFDVEVSWKLSALGDKKDGKAKSFNLDSNEITPKLWAESIIEFMKDPDEFEFISLPYNRMVAANSKLKLGAGKLFKYVDEQCYEFLEWKREKNDLFIRRRT